MPEAHLSNDSPAIEPSAAMAKRHTPIWAWFFFAICMVMPIFAVMSELPAVSGVIGAVSAIACIFVARNSLSVKVRVFICSLITAGTLAIFIWHLVVALNELFDRVEKMI